MFALINVSYNVLLCLAIEGFKPVNNKEFCKILPDSDILPFLFGFSLKYFNSLKSIVFLCSDGILKIS